MRDRLKRLAGKFTDALTVEERWLVFVILMIVVLGSFVKYCRARPEKSDQAPATHEPATAPPDDDR